ncbi:sulfide-dependent adenosine diphosphate thiazole synthase [Hippea sp. KM1]|uniref:sulfide-dependent adenosine diphosphate thiazole synthase n=1 Tax=Hippea sp. KM1 TaxID=944481 RepID=UPI00046D2289|nr:sulfide-dependent adenosine diphosphate thiazole synthase [Hippea sp. KM1]
MNNLDEKIISKAIVERYMNKLIDYLECDAAIVGGGPAGLVCAYYLAKANVKVAIFDKRLTIGGGMWGGAMLFNEIVVQDIGREILEEFGINYEKYTDGYYTADSIEATTTLISKAVKAGAKIFNAIEVEDVVFKKIDGQYRVNGLVVGWTTVNMAHLLVDPLVITSKYVVDATGHDAEIASILTRKGGIKLNTPQGVVVGEKPMWAEVGEQSTIEETQEVYPGLIVAGMAAVAVSGSHRMGPVFGGMLNSGKKAAQLIIENLKK